MTAHPGSGRRIHLLWILPLSFFLLGYSGVLESAAKQLTLFYKSYALAELAKLQATGNVDPQGTAEYVVSIRDSQGPEPDRRVLESIGGVSNVRPTRFSGWYVVGAQDAATVRRIRESDRIKFSLPNRGLWICH